MLHLRWLTVLMFSLWLTESFAAEDNIKKSSEWTIVTAPGSWEQQAQGKFKDYDGYAWYRCYVKVPDIWVAFKEEFTEFTGSKNLFAQSVTITTQDVSNVVEIYVNGEKIGGVGTMPPNYQIETGYQRTKVPPKLLQKGVYNTIAFRVYNHSGAGGFTKSAPIISGYFDECIFDQELEFRTGDDPAWAIASRVTKPEHAAYDKMKQSTSLLDRPAKFITGQKLTPAASLQTFTLDDDLAIDQILTEPQIAQPTEMFFDERGRLWVVEYRQYPYPAGMKIISRDHYYRAVYDKVSPPPPNHFKGDDRISIHEDTDHDGIYDKHTNFLADLNMAISAVKARGGIWVLNSPYLLFFPDKNQDDVPDGPPEVHLEGFGLDDAHSVANGIRLGPDGWLYFIQGSTVSSRVKRPADPDNKLIYCEGKGTWRYHPEKKIVELFNEGGYNALGLDFDSDGRLFGGLNAGTGRVMYEFQGSHYPKGAANKFGPVLNPYIFGEFEALEHGTKILRFDHSVIRYQAPNLPARFHDQIVSIDPLHQNMYLTELKSNGSTFQTYDIGEPLKSNDIGFRPVMIAQGPDGNIYVADFYEQFIAHGQHYQGQLDPSTGRIYRIKSKNAPVPASFDLNTVSSRDLLPYFTYPNKWFRQTALRILGDRQDKSILDQLHAQLNSTDSNQSLYSFWTLNLLGELNTSLALKTLNHPNHLIRFWTVRLLGDQKIVDSKLAEPLINLARTETDPEVRAQLAASTQRFSGDLALKILAQLITHDEDVNDQYIPLLIWWGLETHADTQRAALLKMSEDPSFWKRPLVIKHLLERISRRYALAGSRQDLLTCATLLEQAPDPASRKLLLTGFELAYKGRSLGSIPPELVKQLTREKSGSLTLNMRLGDQQAINQALQELQSTETKPAIKTEYIQILGELQQPAALPVMLELFSKSTDETLIIQLLASLQNYDSPQIAESVLGKYSSLTHDAREVAQTLLASRKIWSQQLIKKIQEQKFDPKLISIDTARKMSLHQDSELIKAIATYWKETQSATDAELREKINKFHAQLGPEHQTGDPYIGKKIFLENCAKCHKLFTDGQSIGPDLTPYKRDDKLRMLLHIVNPNAEIREGFENFLALTDSGRVYTGYIVEQDQAIVTLRGTDGQNVTLKKEELLELKRQPQSLMPTGLLDKLTDQQLRDLFAYLQKSQPISELK